jgi:hypothetical protein
VTTEDEAIRSRLHSDAASARSAAPASVVLGQLGPRLRRARRMRRIVIGTTCVALIGPAAAALQLSLDARATTVRTYGENEGGLGVDELTGGTAKTDGRGPASTSAQSSLPDDSVATSSTAEPTTETSAPPPTSPGIGAPAAPIPGPPTVPATDLTAPAVDPPVTAPQPPTAFHQVDSACGSILVETVDDRVDLVEVMANAGFDFDVEHDGPERVEVSLHGGDGECELQAAVVGGQLVTTVEGPGSDVEPEGPESDVGPGVAERYGAQGSDGSDEDGSDEEDGSKD